MNEVTRLLSRIAALESSSGRTPANPPHQADSQTDRNFYYNRYLGLISVINEGITEEDEQQARAAQECFNEMQSFINESLSDNSSVRAGLVSIQGQLDKAKKGTESVECCICYMPLTKDDCCVMPKCWHGVHSSCFLSWARTNADKMGDHGLRDQNGDEIPELADMFPRVGVCPCPLKCPGHSKETWEMSLQERDNAILERGSSDGSAVDPIMNGNGYMQMLREKKQVFAISGDTIANYVAHTAKLSEMQQAELKKKGFFVEARLPGKAGDNGVCNPPDLATYAELGKVDLRKIEPKTTRIGDVTICGVKGMSFDISDVPEGWTWDELPDDASVRLTKARGRSTGGNLRIDLSASFVKEHNPKFDNNKKNDLDNPESSKKKFTGRKRKRTAVQPESSSEDEEMECVHEEESGDAGEEEEQEDDAPDMCEHIELSALARARMSRK